jgi:hypothetical protein
MVPKNGRSGQDESHPAAGSSVAGASGMVATGTALVVISTFVAAIDPAFPLNGLADAHNTDAITACAFHHFDCCTHCISPSLSVAKVIVVIQASTALQTWGGKQVAPHG